MANKNGQPRSRPVVTFIEDVTTPCLTDGCLAVADFCISNTLVAVVDRKITFCKSCMHEGIIKGVQNVMEQLANRRKLLGG